MALTCSWTTLESWDQRNKYYINVKRSRPVQNNVMSLCRLLTRGPALTRTCLNGAASSVKGPKARHVEKTLKYMKKDQLWGCN